jgi:DNA-binding XRE family transcriptional regulator
VPRRVAGRRTRARKACRDGTPSVVKVRFTAMIAFLKGGAHPTNREMTRTKRAKAAGDAADTAPTPAEAARRALYVEAGARIRSVRKELGVTQVECARGAFIDASSVFRIETGAQNWTLDTLARIALSLGVGMDVLLTGVMPDPDLLEPRIRD